MPRLASRLLLLAASLLLLAQTHAQSIPGAFLPLDTRWLDQNNTPGTLYMGGADLYVDRNGDGLVGPTQDPVEHITLPSQAQGALNYFLSPTREFLYVSTNVPQNGCTGQTLLFYRLTPASQPPTLVHQLCLSCGVDNGGIPEFFDTGITQTSGSGIGVSTQRWALVRTGALLGGDPCGNPRLIFLDLNRPGATGRATIDLLHPGVGTTRVARSGNYVLIQHDLSSGPADSDWALIDLCPSTFGQIMTGPGFPFDDISGPPVQASITSVSAGTLDLLATDGNGHTFAATLPDCLAAAAPMGACCTGDGCVQATQAECASLMGAWQQGVACTPTTCNGVIGACCLPGNTCLQLPQSLCGGTWSSGQPCSLSTCPRPVVSLSVSAPSSVPERSAFVVTVVVRNDGNVAATNAMVTVPIPSGGSFVSATGGGALSSGQVRWSLGTLGPAAVRTLTATVRGACGNLFASINTSTITFNQSPFSATAAPVSVAQVADGTGLIEGTLVSVPSRVPLHAGDTISHTITLHNTANQPRATVRFSMNAGANARIAQITSLGGGVNTVGGSSLLAWEGPLGANATTTITLITRVNDCLSTNTLSTGLNFGSDTSITDACSRTIGSITGQPVIPITPAITTTIGLLAPQTGQIGPRIVPDESSAINDPVQAIRVGTFVTFDLSVSNNEPIDRPDTHWTVTFPSGLSFPNGSPIVGTAPDELTWTPSSRTLEYLGPIAGLSSVSFTVGFIVDQGATRATLWISGGSTSTCFSDIDGSLTILGVRSLPANDVVLGTHAYRCLTVYDPVSGGGFLPLLDCPGEIYWSSTRATDGDVWITGLPLIRFNPLTLDMEIPGEQLRTAMTTAAGGSFVPHAAEWDESTGTLIAMAQVNGQGAILRIDPPTNRAELIQRDAAFTNVNSLVVDSHGRIIVPVGAGLRRISHTPWSAPLAAGVGEVLTPAHPAYTYAAIGTIISRRITWIEPLADDRIRFLTAADFQRFDGAPGVPPTVDTLVFGLLSFDPATAATSVIHSSIAAAAYGNPVFSQTVHPEVQPLLANIDLSNSAFTPMATQDQFLVKGRILHELDAAAGTMTTRIPNSFFYLDTADMLWYPVPGARCIGDFNQDGGVDGSDINAFFDDWVLGLSTADANQDGGVDGADVGAFFDAWQAGC